jgi:hypothetical protein
LLSRNSDILDFAACGMSPKRLRENKCDGNEKQNAGRNRQNLDGVIALTVAV